MKITIATGVSFILITLTTLAVIEYNSSQYNRLMWKELDKTVKLIEKYRNDNNTLPKNLSDLPPSTHKDILYESYKEGTYFLTFKTKGLFSDRKEGYHYTIINGNLERFSVNLF